MVESQNDPLSSDAGDGEVSRRLLERLAHDLRGPLSPLQTAAYLLRRDDIEADRRGELLEIIERQTTRLSAMVQEVSDWTRACQSRLVEHRRPMGAALLVELGCAPAGPAVRLDLPESLDAAMVDGDAQRLVQMLSTLVAFMQTRSGDGLSVRAHAADGQLHVIVDAAGADWTGAERETLFTQAQSTPFDEGLGLRLLLAQAIAQAHGGSVAVGGAGASGSGLEVRLPLLAR